MDRKTIEAVHGPCSKAKAANYLNKAKLAQRIVARIESGLILHYDEEPLLAACVNLLDGKALTQKQNKAWDRYKELA